MRQELAPQQLQSLEILLATVAELDQKISQELVENPTLELVGSGTQDLIGNLVEHDTNDSRSEEMAASAAEKDESIANLVELEDAWRDYLPPSSSGGATYSSDDEERRQYMLDSLVDQPSLQEQLLAQLRQFDDLDDATRRVCEEVIGNIDEKGYLRAPLEEIALSLAAGVEDVQKSLKIIQGFDPAGIGARDLRECLLLQLERQNKKNTLVYKAISKHLDLLGRNQIPKVARSLRVSPAQVYEIIEEIRDLTPFPGTEIASEAPNFVVPEVFVSKDEDGEWQVRTNRECTPQLRISTYYLNLLKNPDTPKDVKSYVRQKVGDSKILMRALGQRQSTIERITRSLLVSQLEFFENGIQSLKPLVLHQVAEDIGVHETTVSRAIANKYVQTPHGLLPFKVFFSSGLENTEGEMISSRSIRREIEELIRNENSSNPYSDEKLTKLLKEQGMKVARRTVAKYREELGILPSNMRRSY
jgi:RNA polymerase sigma-54 factor